MTEEELEKHRELALAELEKMEIRSEVRFAVTYPFVKLSSAMIKDSQGCGVPSLVRVGSQILKALELPEMIGAYRTDTENCVGPVPADTIGILMNRWYVIADPALAEDEVQMEMWLSERVVEARARFDLTSVRKT
jgi:hypothetical protein